MKPFHSSMTYLMKLASKLPPEKRRQFVQDSKERVRNLVIELREQRKPLDRE